MKDALIGYTGFVGNILKKDIIGDYYNSKNINDIKNKSYKNVYCAGVSAVKWFANKNPNVDMENIDILLKNIKTIKCEKLILVSTIGIYDNEPYGYNRKSLEEKLTDVFGDKLFIVRLPAVYGEGLKKNLLYDMLNNSLLKEINLGDTFQWYNVDNIKTDIDNFLEKNYQLIELYPEPITNKELIDLFDADFNVVNDKENVIKQNIVPKNGYIYSSDEVKKYLKIFIDGYN